MADLIAYQSGDWTGATTWKGVATSTGAIQTNTTNSTGVGSSYVYSPTFTITNGVVIEGLLLHCRRGGTTSSGTATVALSDDNGVTATREVTVNASDIPWGVATASWVFFKFGTPLTGDGGTDYRIGVKGTVNNNVLFSRSATTADWARYLRTDATATIGASDRTFIAGELTAPGTVNALTVTMDSTASTAYGNLDICYNGTLSYGTSASTNYILDLAGTLNIWDGGTLNIGTSTTRIPSTSTAVLEFNCASNVEFGLEVRNAGTVNIYGAEKANTKVLLTADAASGQAVITVEDTTGWANGDEVAIASTTRTPGQSEKRTISSIGSATQATMTANLGFAHQGTAPYQGEVINLTRNVKIRGTSATLQSYVLCQATSNFTADNAEFFFLGSGTANRRGIDSATTSAGTFSMNNCAIRDFTVANSLPLNISGASGSASITNNVFFSPITTSAGLLQQNATTGTPIITGNWAMSLVSSGASNAFQLNDAGATVTGNRVVGGVRNFVINENAPIGTFANNVGHTGFFGNIFVSSTATTGTISDCVSFRSNEAGFSISSPVTLDNCQSYHNLTSDIACGNDVKVINSTFNGGTGQSLGASNRHVDVSGSDIVFENCQFGQTNQAANFANVLLAGGDATFIDCDIAESLQPLNQDRLFSPTSTPVIGLDKLNGTSGNHRAYKRYGYAGSDQSVYRTSAPSEVLVPNTSGEKLPSGSKRFGVASGTSATVNVYIRKSATYNGNQPRLIVKANLIAGITTDTVLDTMTVGTESWEQLTGTTATVSDDCVLEVYVDCDGTAGTVNVDDWSVT